MPLQTPKAEVVAVVVSDNYRGDFYGLHNACYNLAWMEFFMLNNFFIVFLFET